MKTKYVKIINLIVALLVALFCIGQVFAWFADGKRADELKFGGSSAGAYFAYGDGTDTKKTTDGKVIPEGGDLTNWDMSTGPFGINSKYHMYNLAWLQDTGRLDGTQYYFELDPQMNGELDMEDYWIPPIGNDKYQFEGIFNGNGKTIANLKVTTDKEKLENGFNVIPASPDYEFSNAVGLFGYTNDKSKITNFILDNPYVEAARDNTLYAGSTSNKVIGIAIGHVGGLCQSIGVYAHDDEPKTFVDVRLGNYSTFNSILGELGDNVNSSVTGGGHVAGSGGGGASFGSNFDIEKLLWRLQQIEKNKNSDTPSWRFPDIDDQNENPVPRNLDKVAFTVDNTLESEYVGADAQEYVSDKNIGYFLGNQNKIEITKELRFGKPYVLDGDQWVRPADDVNGGKTDVPRWIYTFKNGSGGYDTTGMNIDAVGRNSAYLKPLSQAQMDALPVGILDLLAPLNTKERFTSIRLSQTYTNSGPYYNNNNDGWSYHGQISIMGKTYGEGILGDNDELLDENGNIITGDGYYMDENGYKFNYDEDGVPVYFSNVADFTKKIYHVDSDGHALNRDGLAYFGYKPSGDSNFVFGLLDSDGYYFDENGYIAFYNNTFLNNNFAIYYHDADGYATNEQGDILDVSGGIADENGYIKDASGKGYYANLSNFYPLNTYGVGTDGYLLNADGTDRYKDGNGEYVLVYGYDGVDDEGYVLLNGQRVTFKDDWGGVKTIPAKGGGVTPFKVAHGDDSQPWQWPLSGKTYVQALEGSPAEFHSYTGGIFLPNSAIWFKPQEVGTIKLIMYAEANNESFSLIKITRKEATADDPFAIDKDNTQNYGIKFEEIMKALLPEGVLLYYEYNFTAEDLAAGNIEFMLMAASGRNGADFLYLDLGSSASDDTSGIVPDTVSAVDFIYAGVRIAQKDDESSLTGTLKVGDFIVSASGGITAYNASQTSVYFENIGKALTIAFVRLDGNVTIALETDSSEVYATNPDKVSFN